MTPRTARPRRIAGALIACAVGHAVAHTAGAQHVVPPPSLNAAPAVGPYERARRLVDQGQGALGRAVADSLVAASPPGSPSLAEALWWRATLSTDGARAEQDLRRIIDEFSSSPRVGDATVRIAQLDISRDRPDMAAPALARLVRERPDDPARAEAAYWLARARLELGDTRGGCTALADAAAWARSSETFTRQQVADLRGRLPACDPASVVSVMPPPPPGTAPHPASQPTPRSAPQTVADATPAQTPVVHPAAVPPPAAPASVAASRAAPSSTQRIDSLEAAELRHRNAVVAAAPRPAPTPASTSPAAAAPAATTAATPTATKPAAPTLAVSTPAAAKPAVSTPAVETPSVVRSAPNAVEAGGSFAVQIAAYNQRDGAESLAARLRARGFDARTTGSVAPFRVKIGRYATRAAAAAARATFEDRGIPGFVTDAGDGPLGTPARRP